jgi:hypothetical protein
MLHVERYQFCYFTFFISSGDFDATEMKQCLQITYFVAARS